MKLVKNLKFNYHLKTLTSGLHNIENLDSIELVKEQIESNQHTVNHLKKMISEDTELKQQILFNQNNDDFTYQFLTNRHYYLQFFTDKNFESAFNLYYTLSVTSITPFEKAQYGLGAVEALSQIKSQYMNAEKWVEYKKKYHYVENSLFLSLSDISKKTDIVGLHGNIKEENYNSIRTNLAYLAFLENDLNKVQTLLDEQTEQYGHATVFYKECEESSQIWFTQSINYDKNMDFKNYISSQIKKVKNKP